MPNFVETVSPVRTSITVSLVISLVVNILEKMKVRLVFFCNKPWKIYVGILFTVICLLSMILEFVRSIVFDISEYMQSTSNVPISNSFYTVEYQSLY